MADCLRCAHGGLTLETLPCPRCGCVACGPGEGFGVEALRLETAAEPSDPGPGTPAGYSMRARTRGRRVAGNLRTGL